MQRRAESVFVEIQPVSPADRDRRDCYVVFLSQSFPRSREVEYLSGGAARDVDVSSEDRSMKF